ncbi:50S ribosomal protein L2 [Candidatus Woesearchaeota archaeon]|jgi:large subunit ribosomal protein L2|nr:50S ribosomal protein L2 [Candidatus Woesearchaeota archaeon]MBT4321737.1 50S ribosomal protein L2 [Candidatus Woesearchaeota archaeon]MBT4631171.1 50S ribosomal protein L2 [Candidatus Woesearchaeota archaeon]
MGKRILSQRRGRGTSTYRAPSHRYFGKVTHRAYDEIEKTGLLEGTVKDLINCPGHSAPLAAIEYDNGDKILMFAPQGIHTGQRISSGAKSEIKIGNTVPIKKIPVGMIINNIESKAGDGGKFSRAAGSFAKVIAKTDKKITIEFSSKKKKKITPECRVVVGILAGSGRKEKPILKAGNMSKMKKAKNKLYPVTSGVAMNAVDHPFGSGRGRHMGKPRTVSRHAPPGRKVGSIASRKTGKKK